VAVGWCGRGEACRKVVGILLIGATVDLGSQAHHVASGVVLVVVVSKCRNDILGKKEMTNGTKPDSVQKDIL
jgi:hypothetical protein